METISYRLRSANDGDFDFLFRLKVLCLKGYVEATWGWDENFQHQHFARNFNPAYSQIVVVEGQDVGMLLVLEKGNDIYLSGIYILPEYQGGGLGTIIIRELLGRALDGNLPLRLQFLKVNPARKLYERLGFTIEDETETHYLMIAR